jgi:hypothetical protein
MRLLPDPVKDRPKLYVPNNSLWVQVANHRLTSKAMAARDEAGNSQVVERNLSELADQYIPKDGVNGQSETQRLVEPVIHFLHADDLTKGSVAIEGETVVVGAEKWDRVYRVALDTN